MTLLPAWHEKHNLALSHGRRAIAGHRRALKTSDTKDVTAAMWHGRFFPYFLALVMSHVLLVSRTRRGTSSPKDMMTDMSVELQPFSPGQQPEQPSPPDVEEDLEGDFNLAPVLENLRGMEDWVTRLTGGGCLSAKW